MSGCCIEVNNGVPGGGASIPGLTLPGSVLWTFANDGGPSDGLITTTDATPVFRTWATLSNVGDAVQAIGALYAQESNGNRALFRFQQVGIARNAVGTNEAATGLAPWNTFGVPAGMAGGFNFLPGGGLVQVAFVGLAGVTFQWKCWIIATPFWSATIQV